MSLFAFLLGQSDKKYVFNGYEAVDIGVKADNGKRLLFATCNIGASKPEEYGDYFMWGSTTPNTEDRCYLDDPKLPYHTGTSSGTGWTKYILTGEESYGTVDNKTVLDPEDDAAHVIMGGNWRMPTKTELERLSGESSIWTTENGVYGRKLTSGSKTLFIPAGGYRLADNFAYRGLEGHLQSSSRHPSLPESNFYMSLENGRLPGNVSYRGRYLGLSVRGVIELDEA